MENLCTSCLCAGRKLYFLSETGFEHLYKQIVNEIPVYNISELCVRICWECKALLHKVGNFKEQVKTCYMELLQYVHQNTIKQLTSFSRLESYQNGTISYPEVTVKEDIEEYSFVDDITPFVDDGTPFVDDGTPYVGSMKNNNCDMKTEETETHYEPETFVNDLNMDEIMQRDSGRRGDKLAKQKSKNKPKCIKQKSTKKKVKLKNINQDELETKSCSVTDCYKKEELLEDNNKIEPNNLMKNDGFTNNSDFSNLQNQNEIHPEATIKEEIDDDTPYVDVGTPFVGDVTSYVDVDTPYVDVGTPYVGSRNNDMKEETQYEPEALVNDLNIDKIKKKNSSKKGDKTNTKICKISNAVPKVMNEALSDKPICVECGKTFSSRKTYRYHLNVLHKGQNRYPCPRCGKIYQWKSNLGRHMRTHKARDSGELYCELCDKRFASVATFRQHLRISRRHVSESEFSFMCNDCGKKFVNKTRLRDHIDWEHLKKIKFKCQLCNKPFKCHTSLYVHMQNVHRSKDAKDNLCHVCGKSYQSAAKLKYHIVAMHTSETPYQCQQCNAAFGWYSSLYRHIREVHYKLKVQQKKNKKQKKSEVLPSLLPVLQQIHHSGPV